MAANTAEVRARYAEFFAVMEEMVMAIAEVNMKDWEGTDAELAQETTAQATFNASAAITNVTTSKSTSESAVTATTMEAYMVEAKTINASHQALIEALREKRWNLAETIFPQIFAPRTNLATAVSNFAGDAGTVGADLLNVQSVSATVVSLLNAVEAMIEFRRVKQYSEVNRVLRLALADLETGKANAAAIIDRT